MGITRGNQMMRKFGWIFCIVLVFGLVFSCTAMAAGIVNYVDIVSGSDIADGTTQATSWKTLHHALSQMTDGGTLNVAAGVYSVGNGEADTELSVPFYVTILGEPGAVIDGTGAGSGWWAGLSISASNVKVQGLTISNFTNGYGIAINDVSPTIDGNIIHDCSSGISLSNSMVSDGISPIIQNNLIYACTWVGIGGMSESNPLNPRIYHNTIDGINGTTKNGISLEIFYGSPITSAPEIMFNIITNITYSGQYAGEGVAVYLSDDIDFSSAPDLFGYNDFYGNRLNYYFLSFPQAQVQSTDITTDPLYAGQGDYHLSSSSDAINAIPESAEPATPVGTDLDGIARPQGTRYDIGCYEYYSGGSITTGTVTWDGNSDGDGDNTSWDDPNNWDTDQVPGVGDIAVISMDGTYTVTLGGDVAVKGIILGAPGNAGTQTLNIINNTLTLTDTGASQVEASGTLTLNNANISGAGDVKNNGTVLIYNSVSWDAGFENAAGATLRMEGPSSGDPTVATFATGFDNYGTIEIVHGYSSRDATLNVTSGTLVNKTGANITTLAGSGPGPVYLGAELNNQGTVTINQPLDINKTSAHHLNSGVIDVADNYLTITQSGASPYFANTGAIRAASGKSFIVNSGVFESTGENISGNLAFADVTLKDTTIPADANLAMTRGGLDSTATLTNKGRITVFGDCAMDGVFVTAAGSLFRVEGSSSGDSAVATFATGFDNYGTIEIVHGSSYRDATLQVTSGRLVNKPGANITTLSGDGDGLVYLSAEFDNQGTITVSAPDPLDVSKSSAHHVNSGIINVSARLNINQSGASPSITNTGTMAVASGAILYVSAGSFLNNQGGIIKGNGTIDLSSPTIVENSGIVSPGMSPGELSITGDAVQNADGTLEIEIGGPDNGDFDRLNISGNATMGGTLNVSLINSYDPAVSTVFRILNYGSYNGTYGTVNLPLLSQKVWRVNRADTFTELSVAPDVDGDNLDDTWENQYFGNLDQNSTTDYDNDGLPDGAEYLLGTIPNNPDSDNDGYLDGEEVTMGTDPLDGNSRPVYPAGDYYVDANRADFGNGSVNTPWNSLHAAFLRINGGAAGAYTLHVLDGTYEIPGHEPDEPLTLTQPNVTIVGEGSIRPVLDGTDATQWINGLDIEASGVVVRNLDIQNFGTGIFVLDCSPVIEKNNIHDNQVYGINIYFGGNT